MAVASAITVHYKDLAFRLVASMMAAHFIVSFGEPYTLLQLLSLNKYYKALLISSAIAFILCTLVRYATIQLDKRWSWREQLPKRAAAQFTFGLLVPAVVAFLLALAYFSVHGYRLPDTYYLSYDFPIIILLLILLNVFYVAYYALSQWKYATGDRHASPGSYATVFLVQEGKRNVPVGLEDIGYFYHSGDYNLLKSNDNHDYLVAATLEELQLQVDPQLFFRANRQMIVSRKACLHFQLLPFGKLELEVAPPFKEPVIISRKRATAFKEWMERKPIHVNS